MSADAGGGAPADDEARALLDALVAQRTAELQRAKDAAEAADAAKAAVLARIAHEVRTPMNAILGFARLLEGELEDPEQRDYALEIVQAGERLLALIESLPAGRDERDA